MDIELPNLEKNAILVVDDDDGVVASIDNMLKKLKPQIEWADTLEKGLQKISSRKFDLVFLDVNLPDGNGIEAINTIRADNNYPIVIIMTAFSDPRGAELAIRSGAWNYIQKPIQTKDIRLQAFRAIQYLEQKNRASECIEFDAPQIIGSSRAMTKSRHQAAQIANTDSNVLITGETGTGKELFARAIHKNSARRAGDFIVVDCTSLSENLTESLLFGHEKGVFTGADKKRKGLIALANGGTLFLDEVGELPLSMQASFLRVLQEKTFRPLGSETECRSDFRLICATNKDLDLMASENRFRDDLLFRLRSLSLALPPLRDRRSDILEIAAAFLEGLGENALIGAKKMAPDFIEALSGYDWPGNVRELVHTLEASVASAQGEPLLFAYHLPLKLRIEITCRNIQPEVSAGTKLLGSFHENPPPMTYQEFLNNTEKEYLTHIHRAYDGDIVEMIKTTGISRAVLYRKLKSHSIK